MAKHPKNIQEQIDLLKSRNMAFKEVSNAPHFLANISYYRLKGYWWEMQKDKVNHRFADDSYFEEVINLYNFDRNQKSLTLKKVRGIFICYSIKSVQTTKGFLGYQIPYGSSNGRYQAFWDTNWLCCCGERHR